MFKAVAIFVYTVLNRYLKQNFWTRVLKYTDLHTMYPRFKLQKVILNKKDFNIKMDIVFYFFL